MEIEGLVAVVSLLVSIALAVYYFKDRRRAAFELESQHTSLVLAWHQDVVETLARLRFMARDPGSDGHMEDLARLSALIEQGRFFFPNIIRDNGFGNEKPSAYRGYRNLALDFLVASFNLLHAARSQSRQDEAERLQRYFTSIVFEVVRPQDRLQSIRQHTDRYFVVEKTFESFLSEKDGKLIEHIWRKPGQNS